MTVDDRDLRPENRTPAPGSKWPAHIRAAIAGIEPALASDADWLWLSHAALARAGVDAEARQTIAAIAGYSLERPALLAIVAQASEVVARVDYEPTATGRVAPELDALAKAFAALDGLGAASNVKRLFHHDDTIRLVANGGAYQVIDVDKSDPSAREEVVVITRREFDRLREQADRALHAQATGNFIATCNFIDIRGEVCGQVLHPRCNRHRTTQP